MRVPVPVTVVTGFLGAGKTTLVNKWLASIPRGEVAVIVNEHGAVGIDAELLAARVETIIEITGGCICCATQAELVHALDTLASSARRVLVETSGAASPAAVLRAIASGGRTDAFTLDGVVTVVDATRIDTLDEHDLALEQIGYADIVVLSRTDLCTTEAATQAASVIATQNGAALTLPSSDATLDDLLARRTELPPAPPPAARPHVYESIALTLAGSIDGERFADFMETELARFAGRLFRTKGILSLPDVEERMIVQGVGDAVEVTFGEPWASTDRTSRLVIVGFGLDREALTHAFAACAAG